MSEQQEVNRYELESILWGLMTDNTYLLSETTVAVAWLLHQSIRAREAESARAGRETATGLGIREQWLRMVTGTLAGSRGAVTRAQLEGKLLEWLSQEKHIPEAIEVAQVLHESISTREDVRMD